MLHAYSHIVCMLIDSVCSFEYSSLSSSLGWLLRISRKKKSFDQPFFTDGYWESVRISIRFSIETKVANTTTGIIACLSISFASHQSSIVNSFAMNSFTQIKEKYKGVYSWLNNEFLSLLWHYQEFEQQCNSLSLYYFSWQRLLIYYSILSIIIENRK